MIFFVLHVLYKINVQFKKHMCPYAYIFMNRKINFIVAQY